MQKLPLLKARSGPRGPSRKVTLAHWGVLFLDELGEFPVSLLDALRQPVEDRQYLSIRYSQRLAENGVVASVGSKGDSYDNAMIESFNGLYKWELIYPHGPWHGLEDVEFATLEYVDWFNHRRRHGEILPGRQFTTPAAHEAAHYRQNVTADQAVTQ